MIQGRKNNSVMRVYCLTGGLIVNVCLGVGVSSPLAASTSSQLCRVWIQHTENKERLPHRLLAAIAHVESGRWDATKRRVEPWPWTINAEGQGFYFASKEEASRAIRGLQARGVKNIDVGCMQVNLMHHGHAFTSIEHALDPQQNIAYAARFLKQLRQAHASWDKAVAHYHSSLPAHHIPYRQRVYKAFVQQHGRADVLRDSLREQRPLQRYRRYYWARGEGRLRNASTGYGLTGARRPLNKANAWPSDDPVRQKHVRFYKTASRVKSKDSSVGSATNRNNP